MIHDIEKLIIMQYINNLTHILLDSLFLVVSLQGKIFYH